MTSLDPGLSDRLRAFAILLLMWAAIGGAVACGSSDGAPGAETNGGGGGGGGDGGASSGEGGGVNTAGSAQGGRAGNTAAGTGASSGQVNSAGSTGLPREGFSVLLSTQGRSALEGVAIDSEGNAVAVGYSGGNAAVAAGSLLAAKVDASGKELWRETFAPSGEGAVTRGNALALAKDDSLWIAGELTGELTFGTHTVNSGGEAFGAPMGTPKTQALVVKLDKQGQPVFARTFAGDNLRSVAVDGAGNVYLLGAGATPEGHVFVLVLDSSGQELTRREFPTSTPRPASLAVSETQLAIVGTGRIDIDLGEGPVTLGKGSDTPFVGIFARSDFSLLFHQVLAVPKGNQVLGTVLLDDDGTVTISGSGDNFYVTQLDAEHVTTFPTELGEDNGRPSLVRHSSGDFFLTGRGNTPNSATVCAHLNRLSPGGSPLDSQRFPVTGDSRSIAADAKGNIFIAGMLEDPGDVGFGALNATYAALLVRLQY